MGLQLKPRTEGAGTVRGHAKSVLWGGRLSTRTCAGHGRLQRRPARCTRAPGSRAELRGAVWGDLQEKPGRHFHSWKVPSWELNTAHLLHSEGFPDCWGGAAFLSLNAEILTFPLTC